MKRSFLLVLALSIAMPAAGPAFAQDDVELTDAVITPVAYLGGGCDESTYDCGICDSCCGTGGWIIGAEVIFLKAAAGSNEAFMQTTGGESSVRSFSFDYDPAFRAWTGYQNCDGFGARARYFYYDQDANPETAVNPANSVIERDISESNSNVGGYLAEADIQGAGGSFAAFTGLQVQALDIEAVQTIAFCNADVTMAGGVRYGRLESTLGAASFAANGALDQAYFVATNFEGWGPTIAVDARRPIRNGNLALLAGMRASVLFGESDTQVFTATGNTGDDFMQLDRDSGVFIGEVMFGAEYSRCFANGIQATLRGAWEGQYWTGAPLATSMGENFSDPNDLFLNGFNIGLEFAR
jgi:hypothetical protein